MTCERSKIAGASVKGDSSVAQVAVHVHRWLVVPFFATYCMLFTQSRPRPSDRTASSERHDRWREHCRRIRRCPNKDGGNNRACEANAAERTTAGCSFWKFGVFRRSEARRLSHSEVLAASISIHWRVRLEKKNWITYAWEDGAALTKALDSTLATGDKPYHNDHKRLYKRPWTIKVDREDKF